MLISCAGRAGPALCRVGPAVAVVSIGTARASVTILWIVLKPAELRAGIAGN
jgi:hypothetical protein